MLLLLLPFIMNYVITGRLWWGFNLESATRFSSQFWTFMQCNLNSHQLASVLWAKIINQKQLFDKTRNKINANQPQKWTSLLWHCHPHICLSTDTVIPLANCGPFLRENLSYNSEFTNICVDMCCTYSVGKSHAVYKVVWRESIGTKLRKLFYSLVVAKTLHLLDK